MNALILSAVMGVVMMFSGIVLKQKAAIRMVALTGLFVILVLNILDTYGVHLFSFGVNGMMHFDRFALYFVTIIFTCTFLFFLLSAKEMEKVGMGYADYFALIFFILCGIILAASFH